MTRAALDQPHADLGFERRELAGHGRLGHDERLGGAPERAMLGDRPEHLETASIEHDAMNVSLRCDIST